MRALLILYMTKVFLFEDTAAYGVYAAYGSLVYATPLIGGMLADRILGYRKAILLGGILMAVGHFLLSFQHPVFFYGSLALLVVGNGFFKPNISSFVGALYDEKDARREPGFFIFYMGINIGGAVAPLLCAWLATVYGWHFGFGLAGIGMLLGLLVFQRGLKADVFEQKGLVANQQAYDRKRLGMKTGQLVTLGSLLAVPLLALVVYFHEYEHWLIWLVAAGVLAVLAGIYRQSSGTERKQLLAIVYFTSMATLFWAIFEQSGSSVTLFADRNVDLVGFTAAQTNSFNAAFIILMAIPFSLLWKRLDRMQRNPSSPVKLGIGMLLVGAGFLLFAVSAQQATAEAQVPMLYLVLGYFVLTLGELFISTIGLSKMTELAPARYAAFIMGVWFLSSFFGHFFAGKIAALTAVTDGGETVFTSGVLGDLVAGITGYSAASAEALGGAHQQLFAFVSTYAGVGLLAIAVGLVGLLTAKGIRLLMVDVD